MKRLFYLMLVGLLAFSAPAIATTTGSVEKEVVIDIDIGEITDADVSFVTNDYATTAEVKRSDGSKEHLYSIFDIRDEAVNSEVIFSDKFCGNAGNENRPYLNININTPSLLAYRKARDGLRCTE